MYHANSLCEIAPINASIICKVMFLICNIASCGAPRAQGARPYSVGSPFSSSKAAEGAINRFRFAKQPQPIENQRGSASHYISAITDLLSKSVENNSKPARRWDTASGHHENLHKMRWYKIQQLESLYGLPKY
jgi:hypothetical protein